MTSEMFFYITCTKNNVTSMTGTLGKAQNHLENVTRLGQTKIYTISNTMKLFSKSVNYDSIVLITFGFFFFLSL